MTINYELIEKNIRAILAEIKGQDAVGMSFPEDVMSFDDVMSMLDEWVEVAGEYGIAYETTVSLLERHPSVLTGSSAVRLLELGLILVSRPIMRPTDNSIDARVHSL